MGPTKRSVFALAGLSGALRALAFCMAVDVPFLAA
jgi:hypothetical protein